MGKQYCVYIMTNKGNTVLYTGVTNSLARRVSEHQAGIDRRSFTARYNVNKLVYVEAFDKIQDAIGREKQIKKGPRRRKVQLITGVNPDWRDLTENIVSS